MTRWTYYGKQGAGVVVLFEVFSELEPPAELVEQVFIGQVKAIGLSFPRPEWRSATVLDPIAKEEAAT